jgi:protein gp37
MTTKIQWTDQTWNPIVGCSKISPGCDHCYAERMACRLSVMLGGIGTGDNMEAWEAYSWVARDGHWTGKTSFVKSALRKPLHWRKPRRIFVCSMGDLFHESVPFEWIDRVFRVIALRPQHTFQVLTKRAARMAKYFASLDTEAGLQRWSNSNGLYGRTGTHSPTALTIRKLPNVWLGVTAENRKQADLLIPHLLRCPAAVRFLSVEPMLEAVDIIKGLCAIDRNGEPCGRLEDGIDWVICGGESGPGARPVHPDWIRDLRDQCAEAAIPFFFKQWGSNPNTAAFAETNGKCADMTTSKGGSLLDGKTWHEFPETKP